MRKKNECYKLAKLLTFVCFFVLSLCFFSNENVYAQLEDVVDTKESHEVFLHRGDIVSLKVYSLTRIALSRPGVVDIANADVDEVMLIGQNLGETPIFIWDEYGKRMITARVIEEDLDSVASLINSLLASAKVKGVILEKNFYEGKIVATGKFNKAEEAIVNGILGQYASRVINMVRENKDLIQIDAQVSELSTTLTKILGIDWNTGAKGLILGYSETLPVQDGSLGDLFKIGDFRRTTTILATVNALIEEGKGRVLSKPSLVVTNGDQASFLVGGEIPIRTTTTSTGGASVQENITFTSYGVDLTITPEIKDNKIDLQLSVQIRDIDAANAVGTNVAFTTRTAQTKLLLNNGQTIVLAGLIKHNQGETLHRVPFLSAIPVVGGLFRSKSYSPNSDTEVVISLTPHVIRQPEPTEEMGTVSEKITTNEKKQEAGTETAKSMTAVEKEGISSELNEASKEEVVSNPEVPEKDNASLSTLPKTEEDISEKQGATLSVPNKKEKSSLTTKMPEPSAPVFKDEKMSKAVSSYVQGIQQKIAGSISFPYEAKDQGWEGTVVLNLVILPDGSVKDVSVKESSGYDIFDKDAVTTARILAPFDPLPADLGVEELGVTIPIVYSQKTVLEGSDEEPLPKEQEKSLE